ncbi:MAG: Ig domain-containing protein, partial [Nitrososphaerales archaeon]
NTLTFSLVGAPAGASINPSTGVFTWTPTEEQGPDAYTFDVVVTDNGDPNLSDSETITVTVDEVESFLVKMGTFIKTTSTVPVTQVISGVGFKPKALILFTNAQLNQGLEDGYNFALGFSDGTNSRSIGVASDDAIGQSNTGRAFGTKILRILGTGDPSLSAQADLVTFHSDGFTLNWTQNDFSPYIIHYIAIGGDDLTGAKVGNFVANTVEGNQSVTGVGFEPDFLMFMHARATNLSGTSPHAYISYGFAKSPTQQGAIAVVSEDNRSTMDTWRWQRSDRAILGLFPATGQQDAEASLVSMDPDGFTINWINALTNADRVYYLALKGGSYNVGSITQPTSLGTQDVAGVGFKPKAVILTSYGLAVGNTVNTNNRLSFGAANDSNQGNAWVGDRDTGGTSITARSTDTTRIIRMGNPAGTGSLSLVQAEAAMQSFEPDGFKLAWSKVDSVARQLIYIAFG